MASFVRRVVGFAGLLALFALATRGVNQLLLKAHVPSWAGSAEVVFVGDSHVMVGIDDSDFPTAFNIAQAGEPLMVSEAKIAHLLPHLESIEVLVLGVDPHNLAPFNDIKFDHPRWSYEMADRYYGVADPIAVGGIPFSWGAFFYGQAKHLWTPNGHLLADAWASRRGGTADHPYIGSFQPFRVENLRQAALDGITQRHFAPSAEGGWISERQGNAVVGTVDLLRKAGVEVVLLAAPLAAPYRARVPADLADFHRSTCLALGARDGVHCLDLGEAFEDLSLFTDWDHVNASGAERLTREVIDFIESRTALESVRRGS